MLNQMVPKSVPSDCVYRSESIISVPGDLEHFELFLLFDYICESYK